jgi:hypothetical protein
LCQVLRKPNLLLTLALLCSGVVLSITAPAVSLTPKSASNSVWKVFASDAGSFKLLMPGDPVVDQNDGVTAFRVERLQEGAVYTVSYVDFESDPATQKDGVKEAFAGTQQGIQDEGGKILSSKMIQLHGNPGQEIQARLANGMTTRLRAYIVGKRLYLVIVTVKSDRNLVKSIEGYLNSFQVLKR